MFFGFWEGETYVKMKKSIKKKYLVFNWEGLVLFVKYLDGNEYIDHDEGGRMCVIKGKKEQLWDKPWRDLQLFHAALWMVRIEGISLI